MTKQASEEDFQIITEEEVTEPDILLDENVPR